ncbi:hypothetical protein ACIPRD_22065 [Streptomyces sp. NPDC090108]|uniref:hypothetical protein n=1 Tax=Streptomyces sp. NPDC090108 TaxID=3365947 RepID=UPI00380D92F1
MPSSPLAKTAAAVLAALSLGALTSCADQGTPRPAAPSASVTVPRATGVHLPEVKLPLDSYQVSASDFGTISSALISLTRTCMKGAGYDYAAGHSPAPGSVQTGNSRRYGLLDPRDARTHGYHPPFVPDAAALSGRGESHAYRIALTGTGKPTGKKGQFDDGCAGKANALLDQGIDTDAVNLPQWLKRDTFQRSMSRPAVRAVFADWSACMRAKGYSYASPLAPFDDRRLVGAQVTDAERAVAVTDIQCKDSTHLVQKWTAAEAALQDAAIHAHRADLAEARAETAKTVARAKDVLAGHGTPADPAAR